MTTQAKQLSQTESEALLSTLKARFDKHLKRHQGLEWSLVQARLEANPEKLWSVQRMESTGGEPDVTDWDPEAGTLLFCDCSPESPKGRRSTCYDREGLESRKAHRPEHNAVDMAAEMGVEILDETMYRQLQALGDFDCKTSSWILTPTEIRKLGGALFGDRRYGKVFFYHNGAQSYYGARGFRACLQV